MAQPVGWHPARLQNSIILSFLGTHVLILGISLVEWFEHKSSEFKGFNCKIVQRLRRNGKRKIFTAEINWKISEIREEAPSCFAAALLAFRVLHPVQPGFRCQNFYAGSGWKTNRNQVFGAAWCAPTHTVPAFTCLQNIGSTLHCRESTLTSVESFQQKMMMKMSLIGSPAFLRKL